MLKRGRVGARLAGPGGSLFIGALLGALALLLFAVPAGAATTFTPSIEIGLGYDDNIDLERDPVSDFFLWTGARLNLIYERPAWDFTTDLYARYIHYFEETGRSRLENATLLLLYRLEPTATSVFTAFDQFSLSNDFQEDDLEGGLVRIRPGERRLVNTIGVRYTDAWGPKSNWYAGYTYTTTLNEFEDNEDSNRHYVDAGVAWEYVDQWVLALDLFYINTDWEDSPDTWRGGASLTWSHYFGPDMEAFIRLGYEKADSGTDNPLISRLNDYELYSIHGGWNHELSETFEYGFSIGWSAVEGDPATNSAAGQTFNTYSAYARWTGERWWINAYASHDLTNYDTSGDNTGLTRTYRAGISFSYDLAQHWNFLTGVEYVRDEPQIITEQARTGDVDSYRAYASLTWLTSENTSLSLRYSYLSRDGEVDLDDRYRNRILLVFTAKNPYRW